MNLIIKFILTIIAFFTFSFLMFFTFVSDNYTTDFVSQSEDSNLGLYKIDKDYSLSQLAESDNYSDLKLHHVSMGNNVFYKEGNLKIKKNDNQYNLHLEKGVYFFDINDISIQYFISFPGYTVKNMGPGSFIINTMDEKKKSIFSLSSKLNVDFLDTDTKESLVQIDIFPNMYLLAFPRYNKAIKNADLGKIITSHKLNMLSTPIYDIDENNILSREKNDDTEKELLFLNLDLKKYLFYNNSNYDNFIHDVFNFRNYQIKKKNVEYIQLSKNDFYLFPGEKYILKYYKYFLNDEKKKFYYKNVILKELIQLLNNKNASQRNIESIISKIGELKQFDIKEYNNIVSHILYYYDNIIYSQKKNPDIITNISILKERILIKKIKVNQPSLLELRYIYEEYHNGNIQTFHKEMNSFVSNYEKEMSLSVYNKNHKIHNYFLYFLKNIFVGDFSKVKDRNQMVILFKKYIEIKEIFIEQGDKIIKKTALFDNASLIEVFIDIMKISFFQKERNNNLLVLQKPAKITQNNYEILKTNLQLLLIFQRENKALIQGTGNRKDIILALSYLKYNKELNEYFEAINNYNRYELNNSKILVDLPDQIDENQLTKEKANNYLKQFVGVNSPNTIITIRNYAYCLSNDTSKITTGDEYCYEINNFYVKGFKFSFFLTPLNKNRITFLNYYDDKNKPHNKNIEHIMDDIETGLDRLFENAKVADRDKYNFSRFFINKYIDAGIDSKSDSEDLVKDINPFPIKEIGEESIAAKDLKLKLLTKNSPLEKIRNFLPITYKYIKIIEDKGEFIGDILPTSFKVNITMNKKTENFLGKFQGKYDFKGNNHSFKESKIYIENTKGREKYSYFLETQAINIQGNYLLSDTENIFKKILINFNMIKGIFTDLRKKYELKEIKIIYNIDKEIIQFHILDTYIYNIKDNGSIDVYKNYSKIYTGRFNTISQFLNTLQ